jgi:hypothetical protein
MFFWSRPRCPLDSAAKQWVEQRLRWLAEQFGLHVFTKRAVILPLEEFFPDRFDGSDGTVELMFAQVCRYMDVDPDSVELQLFTDRNPLHLVNEQGHEIPHAAGLYMGMEYGSKSVIRLETAESCDPLGLVGTMAHELAHLRLLGEERISSDIYDNELLTDLTVVFHGLGIFLAGSPRTWSSQYGTWPGTELKKPEYMTLPMYGYALAHAAWWRNEQKPTWARYLRPDPRVCMKQSLRYLWETRDSSFAPPHARGSRRKP